MIGSNGGGQHDPMTDLMVIMVAFFVLFIMVGAYYQRNAGPINYALVEFNRVQLYALAHLPGSFGEEAAYAYVELGKKDPWDYSWSQIVALFSYVGRFLRWFIVPILGLFVWWGFVTKQRASDHYRRIFNMATLVQNNVEEYPCMAPIANRETSILDEPYDEGKWRTPRTTIQFVAENKLLLNKKGKPIAKRHLINKNGLANLRSKLLVSNNNKGLSLDKDKARDLFMQQVGPKFNGFDDLPDYIKGLVAAFMAIGAGDKDAGLELLDQMSVTFVEPDEEGDPFKIDISGASKLIDKYKDHENVAYHTDHHKAYLHPYMMALLGDHAKSLHGVLPSSRYIWLRPVNHLLFNVLNQVGGREPWSEGAGAWAHYESENTAGQSLMEPEIANIVGDLEDKLIKTGWMAPPSNWEDKEKDLSKWR